MGSSAVTPFTGSSPFAAQLQQVISTAVARASSPLRQLQSQQSTLTAQQTELQALSSSFSDLQTALISVDTAAQSNALSAQVSDSNAASATVANGALAGTYSLNIVSLGSRSNTISTDSLTKVADPSTTSIDSSSSYTLTVQGQSFTIAPSDNSLSGLVKAINASGANVQATVVNIGGSDSPDYRLSIQGLDYSPVAIQLNDGTNDLLQTITGGSYVQYQINGQPSVPINANLRQVTVSPGLNVTLLGTGSVDITVSSTADAVSNALNAFVTAYNKAAEELDKNRGQNGGALSGQSVIYDLQEQLHNLSGLGGSSGSLTSLSDLGLSFDSNGLLHLDQAALSALDPKDVLNVLGGISTGGFLQAASNILTSITDPVNGTLTEATQTVGDEISHLGTQITDQQTSINNLQNTLMTQMAAADAAISSLEQQLTQITDLFAAMQQYSKSLTG
jgi:flagellar hook-associated protein 2